MAEVATARAAIRRASRERWARRVWFVAAVIGALAGLATLQLHLTEDPLADVRAYYDAAVRLNAGEPLYPPDADTNAPEFYRYPPLLAIAFRPFAALLPYEAVAALWAGVCVATFVGTLLLLGIRRYEVWIAVGVLGLPIAWSLAIGQAQVPVTYLLTIGAPWAVALAANLKVLPALVAIYWLGRRDWRQLGLFAAWMAGQLALQLVLEPQGTLDFFRVTNLQQVGEVRNLSPYAISPVLWVGFVGVLAIVALKLAPTRAGWAAAVTFSVLSPPRLLAYMLMTFLAALRTEPTGSIPRSGGASPPSAERLS
jgi:hypothetical protein